MNELTAKNLASSLEAFCEKNNLWYEKTEKRKPGLDIITLTIAIKVNKEKE